MHEVIGIGSEGFICISLDRQPSCVNSIFRAGISIEVHFTLVGQTNRIVREIARPGRNYVWTYAIARPVAVSWQSVFWQWLIS